MIVIPMVQIRNWKPRKVKKLIQGHTANKWLRWNSDQPGSRGQLLPASSRYSSSEVIGRTRTWSEVKEVGILWQLMKKRETLHVNWGRTSMLKGWSWTENRRYLEWPKCWGPIVTRAPIPFVECHCMLCSMLSSISIPSQQYQGIGMLKARPYRWWNWGSER